MNVACVVGIRPNFVKIAPLIHELSNMSTLNFSLIHTGQHYDYRMSRLFFEELNIPDPDVNLDVGSGTHAFQTAHMLLGLESTLTRTRPDTVIVAGDGNSTLAGALAAAKMHIPVCHVEAGLRSYDLTMPEEINRRLTDHTSSILFTPTRNASDNLLREGLPKSRIYNHGDTMVDSFLMMKKGIAASNVRERYGLEEAGYAVMTCHRSENIDNTERLTDILRGVMALRELPIAFPVHPHARTCIERAGLWDRLTRVKHLRIMEPLGYVDMLALIGGSQLVITDSGGVQKEAFLLRVPCVTLRLNTEWIETLRLGVNMLAGWRCRQIVSTVRDALKTDFHRRFRMARNPFGEGKASVKIAEEIFNALTTGKLTVPSSDFLENAVYQFRNSCGTR